MLSPVIGRRRHAEVNRSPSVKAQISSFEALRLAAVPFGDQRQSIGGMARCVKPSRSSSLSLDPDCPGNDFRVLVGEAAFSRGTRPSGRPRRSLWHPTRPGIRFAHEFLDVGNIVGLKVTEDYSPPLALARLNRNLVAGCS